MEQDTWGIPKKAERKSDLNFGNNGTKQTGGKRRTQETVDWKNTAEYRMIMEQNKRREALKAEAKQVKENCVTKIFQMYGKDLGNSLAQKLARIQNAEKNIKSSTGREQEFLNLRIKTLWVNISENRGQPICLNNLQGRRPPSEPPPGVLFNSVPPDVANALDDLDCLPKPHPSPSVVNVELDENIDMVIYSSGDSSCISASPSASSHHWIYRERRRQHLYRARRKRQRHRNSRLARQSQSTAPAVYPPAHIPPPTHMPEGHRLQLLRAEASRQRRSLRIRGVPRSMALTRQETPEGEGRNDDTGAGNRGGGGGVFSIFLVPVFVLFTYVWTYSSNSKEEEERVEGREIGGTNRVRAGRESPRRWGGAPARWPWLVSRSNTPNSRFLLFRHKWR